MGVDNNLWCQVQRALNEAGIYFRDIAEAERENVIIEQMRKQIRELEAQASPESLGTLERLRNEISMWRKIRQMRMETFFAACREGN